MTATTTGVAKAAAPARQSLNRMDDWTNDDLLLTDGARKHLEAEYPGALDVFDWPALRADFDNVDKTATKSRKRRQRNGVIAVSLAGLGAGLIALLPLLELLGVEVERSAFAISAMLSVLGLVGTLWVTLFDRHRPEWLHNRLRTERLRQLYFQFMAHDPELGARALRKDPAALAEWTKRRDAEYALVAPTLTGPVRKTFTALLDDVNHRNVWLGPRSKTAPAAPARSGGVDDFFAILQRQRIEIQKEYVREKLATGLGSPRTWHHFLQATSYLTALLALIMALFTAYLMFEGKTLQDVPIRVLMSLMALVGVVAIYLKLIGEGLQVKADLVRYDWYRDALGDIDRRFTDPDPAVRIEVLRDMERASYHELREFLKTHDEARFSFG